MSFRDPKNPAPRGGEGSGGDTTGRDRSRTASDPLMAPRAPGERAASSGRHQVDPGRPAREATPRARSVVPPPASSRSVHDPFAEPGVGARRPAGDPADPFAVRGRQARASQPAPVVDDPNDPAAWSDLTGDWTEPGGSEWEELPAVEPERRPAPTRRRARENVRARPGPRTRPTIDFSAARMPAFIGRSDLLTDQISGILIGANLLSLLVMVVRLATSIGQMPAALVVHLDPAGFPDGWGSPTILWRLPLIAGMTLLMNLVVAWFISPIDRFAARFALAAALGVQLIVWIAVLDFV